MQSFYPSNLPPPLPFHTHAQPQPHSQHSAAHVLSGLSAPRIIGSETYYPHAHGNGLGTGELGIILAPLQGEPRLDQDDDDEEEEEEDGDEDAEGDDDDEEYVDHDYGYTPKAKSRSKGSGGVSKDAKQGSSSSFSRATGGLKGRVTVDDGASASGSSLQVGGGEYEEGGGGEGGDEFEPLYVNAKQYHRIMKRRVARARLEEMGRLSRERKVSLLHLLGFRGGNLPDVVVFWIGRVALLA